MKFKPTPCSSMMTSNKRLYLPASDMMTSRKRIASCSMVDSDMSPGDHDNGWLHLGKANFERKIEAVDDIDETSLISPTDRVLTSQAQECAMQEKESGSPKKTPTLALFAIGEDASLACMGRTQRGHNVNMFSLFRPVSHKKVIIVIRHGQSEFNAACQLKGAGWEEPRIFDPHLTSLGCEQTRSLRASLMKELAGNRHVIENAHSMLWVTSPLQRCMETFLLSCPLLPKFEMDCTQTFKRADHVKTQLERIEQLPNVKVMGCIAERLMTYGDIGTPTSALKSRFSQLAPCMEHNGERWWHGHEENCQDRKVFKLKESTADFQKRINEAKCWLEHQPEKVIFLFGHSVFWKQFFHLPSSLKNCEYKVMHW